jgi:hypothetical protein
MGRLHLRWSELRALVERQRRRASDADDWAAINATIEQAGRRLRDDPRWQLRPADPRDFDANLKAAFRDRDPMVDNGIEQVETIDQLYLRLDEPAVKAFVTDTLRLDPAAFAAMMETKRRLDADRNVVDGYLVIAARRRDEALGRTPPDRDAPAEPPPTLEAAVGPIVWDDLGPGGEGVADVIAYLDRVAAVERWFFLPAEKLERLLALLDRSSLDDAARAEIVASLGEAHAAKVFADEQRRMRDLRVAGLAAALADATGEPATSAGLVEALARWTTPETVEMVRAAEAAPGAAPWPRIDAALAQARRRRLALPAPVARREHRHALWVDQFAPPVKPEEARPAFGARPADRDAEPATIGWAIVSPALALSAGHRQVSLTLVFADDDGGALLIQGTDRDGGDAPLRRPFVVDISAGDDWLTPADIVLTEGHAVDAVDPARTEGDRRRIALTLTFTLDAAEPATAPPTGAAGTHDWPMLRLRLRAVRDGDRVTTAYDRYRTLRLLRAELRTRIGGSRDAAGLSPLVIDTDDGRVDGKRPFEPFGAAAPIDARLLIGHPDLAAKRLVTLALRWRWQAPPADLRAHYTNYPARDFTAAIALIDDRGRPATLAKAVPLFAKDTGAPIRTDDLPVGSVAVGRTRQVAVTLAGTDFGHAIYPDLVMRKGAEQAAAMQAAAAKTPSGPAVVDPAAFVVRPPYTPRLRHLSLDLAAEHIVDLRAYDRSGAVDRLYHLHPLGLVEAPNVAPEGWPLLPTYDEEGALYIGLDRVAAPQTLSLLVDAVVNGDGGDAPAGLRWAYLDAEGWTDLPEAPRDTSLGLARTGLVRLALPAAAPDGRMPQGFYWLRASVASGSAGASAIAGLHAQAGSATEVDGDPDATVAAPLPAGTIRGIADPVRGIAKVRQPFAGFGGVPREDEAGFRIRAGEDIRHKGRAVTAWDYERLVLARFPAVHKVKCIPATLAGGLGLVRLVIVPDVRALRLADPFAPRAPAALLAEVEAHIRPLAPATAKVAAIHPFFVRVRVRVAVRFREAGDLAFQKRRLTDAINRHLAPWAFGEGSDIALGQRIEATALVAFVDALPFVDFVAGCRLFQADGDGPYAPGAIDRGEAAASSRPDAVLTPAAEHEIDVIGDEAADPQAFVGIGFMKIGLDLIVASEGE